MNDIVQDDTNMNDENPANACCIDVGGLSCAVFRLIVHQMMVCLVPLIVVAHAIAPVNAQQPAANTPQTRGALFDFTKKPTWFGGTSVFGSSQTADNSRFNAQIPDVQINDGGQRAGNSSQVQNLNQRLGAYDADNQLLNTEIASLQQKLQLANQYNQQLKEQLAGTTGQVQQIFSERQLAAQQISNLQMQLDQANQNLRLAQQATQSAQQSAQMAGFNGGTPAQQASAGGATIRANNSLLQKLSAIQIPGGQARMDGDVIRIEFPSDRMFVPGSYQIQPAQLPVLQNIVGTIAQSFPRQIIGIEAHWDNTPLNPPGTTDHQLTATQGLAVLEQMMRLGLPSKQMFTMAMASNRPRHQPGLVGGVSPNRRIELVIYPETYDGS